MVITGRLSLRDDKEPQIVINRARPMSDFENQPQYAEPARETPKAGTLYLRLLTEEGALFGKIRSILQMFPGSAKVVVFFDDTKQRRGSTCALDERMLKELNAVLGEGNVVIK